MSTKDFLMWVGWVLLVVGVLGYLVGASLGFWVFTANENLAHVVLGLVMLAAAYWAKSAALLKWLTVVIGVLGLYFAAYGWFVSGNYYDLASLEQLDNLVHLVIGGWALWVVWGKK